MFIKGNLPKVMKLEYMWLELGVLAAVEEVYCVQSALLMFLKFQLPFFIISVKTFLDPQSSM